MTAGNDIRRRLAPWNGRAARETLAPPAVGDRSKGGEPSENLLGFVGPSPAKMFYCAVSGDTV